jgi:hypothetical protein
LFGKLAGALFPDPEEAGIENKLQCPAIIMPDGQWSIRHAKKEE